MCGFYQKEPSTGDEIIGVTIFFVLVAMLGFVIWAGAKTINFKMNQKEEVYKYNILCGDLWYKANEYDVTDNVLTFNSVRGAFVTCRNFAINGVEQ